MADDAVEFTIERDARTTSNSAQRQQKRQAPVSPGCKQEDRNGFPDHIQRKYYVVVTKAGPGDEVIHARIYTDRKGEYLAFKDAGDRLSTRNGAPGIVRDMVAVAEHRGWEAISVRGPVEFRREAWLEAAARGFTVLGYEPANLDHATLRKRLAGRGRQASEQAHAVTDLDATSATDTAGPSQRSGLDVGVTGRLVEVGRAPYPGRDPAETSAYVDLALADGSSRRIWGAALPRAIDVAKIEIGDWVRIERDGVERVATNVRTVDGRTGEAKVQRQDVTRNRWKVTAERFRSLNQREALRDPVLAAAHSQVAVLERALKTRFPQDERARHITLDAARERVAEHLEQGRIFGRAEIRASERTAGKDTAEPASRRTRRQEEHVRAHEKGRDR